MTDQDATGGTGTRDDPAPGGAPTASGTATDPDLGESDEPQAADDQTIPADGALPDRQGSGDQEDIGDNVFGGPSDHGPIEPGRPDAENVLFVLLGILAAVLVVMRLTGAI